MNCFYYLISVCEWRYYTERGWRKGEKEGEREGGKVFLSCHIELKHTHAFYTSIITGQLNLILFEQILLKM